jgi:hypothetical protein
MNPDFWEIFHDGTITKIQEISAGCIKIFIEIEYLRKMFPSEGIGFFVVLKNVSCLKFNPYEGQETSIFSEIEKAEPEILYLNSEKNPIIIGCVTGTILLEYEDAEVYLDTGLRLTFDELDKASRTYWDTLVKKHKIEKE